MKIHELRSLKSFKYITEHLKFEPICLNSDMKVTTEESDNLLQVTFTFPNSEIYFSPENTNASKLIRDMFIVNVVRATYNYNADETPVSIDSDYENTLAGWDHALRKTIISIEKMLDMYRKKGYKFAITDKEKKDNRGLIISKKFGF